MFDLHWAIIGHARSLTWSSPDAVEPASRVSCPRAQDSGRIASATVATSSSRRRRLRAALTRARLWRASTFKIDDEDTVEDLELSTFWQSMDAYSDVPCERSWCALEEQSVSAQASIKMSAVLQWEADDIETWIRETMRMANSTALQAKTREKALLDRQDVIDRRWQEARPHVPTNLQSAIWEMLCEPLTA